MLIGGECPCANVIAVLSWINTHNKDQKLQVVQVLLQLGMYAGYYTMILYESLVDKGSPTKSLMPRSAT